MESGSESLALAVTANILSAEARARGGDIYTVYRLAVKAEKTRWVVDRRYREFSLLHRKLQRRYAWSPLPRLPPKRLHPMSRVVIEERRAGLDAYLRGLLRVNFLANDPLVIEFLQANAQTRALRARMSELALRLSEVRRGRNGIEEKLKNQQATNAELQQSLMELKESFLAACRRWEALPQSPQMGGSLSERLDSSFTTLRHIATELDEASSQIQVTREEIGRLRALKERLDGDHFYASSPTNSPLMLVINESSDDGGKSI
mmetsp:Transcript_29628/g.76548  ORF Transcript_29628/g.76548 Transcript_29628/m.76548 type:complete len:262 (-) Transcript_29628:302-1087(-)